MAIRLLPDGSPQLLLHDKLSNNCLVLQMLSDGTANLSLREPGNLGGACLQLEVGPGGFPMVSMVDARGALRIRLGISPDGSGLALYDEEGNVHASLVVFSDGAPGLALVDQHGEVTWNAP